MQLNRYLALSGVASRRKANLFIEAGRVQVNGQTVRKLGISVETDDNITVDGERVQPLRKHHYVLLNKPRQVLTSVSDDRGRKTVVDLVRMDVRLFPVGRLDLNTTGALLLTDDGDLANRLTHPRYRVDKLYHARVKGKITEHAIRELAEGVCLEDGPASGVAKILEVKRNESLVSLQIHQGRKRQVKRMLEAVGFPVKSLDRPVFAGLTVEGLKSGKWRKLTGPEIKRLYVLTGLGGDKR